MSKQKQKNNFCTQHVLNLYFSCNSMNNLSSYCGLTDARMWASEKGLPVHRFFRLSGLDFRKLFQTHFANLSWKKCYNCHLSYSRF